MKKNLTKHNKQPKGMEYGVSDMDARVASSNYEMGAAHMAPYRSNDKRYPPHLGGMPMKGKGLV